MHYIYMRPYLDLFLATLATMGRVVLFTASLASYANVVLQHVDPQGYIADAHYRDVSCS